MTVRKTDQQFIYVLKHPITGRVRYVGRTDKPDRRWVQHRNTFWHTNNLAKRIWTDRLLDEGFAPVMEVVAETNRDEVGKVEREQVSYWFHKGALLNNVLLPYRRVGRGIFFMLGLLPDDELDSFVNLNDRDQVKTTIGKALFHWPQVMRLLQGTRFKDKLEQELYWLIDNLEIDNLGISQGIEDIILVGNGFRECVMRQLYAR